MKSIEGIETGMMSDAYFRGIQKGLEDIRSGNGLNEDFRTAMDEYSFGYRAAFFLQFQLGSADVLGSLVESMESASFEMAAA